MARHLLTDTACRKAQPREKTYRKPDGEGLWLAILPSGIKSWQWRGGNGTASLGKYPAVSLAAAREAAEEVRELNAKGINYAAHKRAKRVERRTARSNTFASVRADWVAREARRCRWAPHYRLEVEASLGNHLSSLDGLPME